MAFLKVASLLLAKHGAKIGVKLENAWSVFALTSMTFHTEHGSVCAHLLHAKNAK